MHSERVFGSGLRAEPLISETSRKEAKGRVSVATSSRLRGISPNQSKRTEKHGGSLQDKKKNINRLSYVFESIERFLFLSATLWVDW